MVEELLQISNEVSVTTNGVGDAKLYSNKVKVNAMDQLAIETSNVLKEGYIHEPNTNTISDTVVEIPKFKLKNTYHAFRFREYQATSDNLTIQHRPLALSTYLKDLT